MKVLKRNQLIVLVISLMLITAGYLNFTTNQANILETSTIASRDDTTIGDAQLVSTIPKENETDAVENLLNGEIGNTVTENLLTESEKPTSGTVDTGESNSSQETEDYYFTTSKLERNTMYSELLDTYQEIYNNANSTANQKSEALTKISEINNAKNAIMIAENLIIAKGFENVVIFVNEGSVSVIIKTEELKQEDIAQIQNIVSRELSVGVDIIHISNK